MVHIGGGPIDPKPVPIGGGCPGWMRRAEHHIAVARRAIHILWIITTNGSKGLVRSVVARRCDRSTAHDAGIAAAVDILEALGPTFIKLGQAVSSRPDLLPAAWHPQLARLQDKCAPPSAKALGESLAAAFDGRQAELFLWLEPVPFASGSVSTVHRRNWSMGPQLRSSFYVPALDRSSRPTYASCAWPQASSRASHSCVPFQSSKASRR